MTFDPALHPKPWKVVFDEDDDSVWLEIVDANHDTVMSYTCCSDRSFSLLEYIVDSVNGDAK